MYKKYVKSQKGVCGKRLNEAKSYKAGEGRPHIHNKNAPDCESVGGRA